MSPFFRQRQKMGKAMTETESLLQNERIEIRRVDILNQNLTVFFIKVAF